MITIFPSPLFFFLSLPFPSSSFVPLILYQCCLLVREKKGSRVNMSFKTYILFLKSSTWFMLSGRVFGAIQLYFVFIILLIVCVYTSVKLSGGKNRASKSSFLSFLSSADTWLPMELWGPCRQYPSSLWIPLLVLESWDSSNSKKACQWCSVPMRQSQGRRLNVPLSGL